MPSRYQRIVSYGIPSTAAATVVVAALLTQGTRPAPAPAPPPADPGPPAVPSAPVDDPQEPGKHAIDVVFALDTTGSMGELLDGARRTVWSIATHIRRTDPNANLRIGLVAYRDEGDDYVTRPFALTHDLDAVYTELAGYDASGGNDVPEHVARALSDSLKMRWRAGAKKLLFVVGDAPPAERADVPSFDVLARELRAAGVTINAIRCGGNHETSLAFEQLARLGGGDFSTIAQDGGVQQVATPYDARLGELSARVDGTAVIAGDEGVRRGYAMKMRAADAAPASAKADRASYYARKAGAAGGKDLRAREDLVGAYATGTLDLGKLEARSLPSELREKSAAELTAELARRAAERAAAQREIAELTKQRDAFLAKRAASGGFDSAVKATVEKQIK